MRVSLSWIQEFTPYQGSISELENLLTLGGMEVDQIETTEDKDTIFHLSLTPNLGRCLSILGIAREIGALANLPIPTVDNLLHQPHPNTSANIDLDKKPQIIPAFEHEGVLSYFLQEIHNLQTNTSPLWMQKRLIKSGIVPKHFVVDVTNYVMLELGQPMHAFDRDKLSGKPLIPKKASSTFKFLCIDGQERTIHPGTLMIWDHETPVAIAGVIGGKNSAITDTTKNIVLESGHFQAQVIRYSSKRIGLRTESSNRFEKEIDPDNTHLAMKRAVDLILSHTTHIPPPQIGTYYPFALQEEQEPLRTIFVEINRVNKLLGTELTCDEMRTLLQRLSIDTNPHQDGLQASIPKYRHDLRRDVDLIEEIARIYGYNRLPKRRETIARPQRNNVLSYVKTRKMRQFFTKIGCQEVLTCNLISPKESALDISFSLNPPLSVLKPSSIDHSILRRSPVTGLIKGVKTQLHQQTDSMAFFEITKVHCEKNGSPIEEDMLGVILLGHSIQPSWNQKGQIWNFFDLKGILIEFCDTFLGYPPEIQKMDTENIPTPPLFNPAIAQQLALQNKPIGHFGAIHPQYLKEFGINLPKDQSLLYGELLLNPFLQTEQTHRLYQQMPQFPGSTRDLTVGLKKDTPVGQIIEFLEKNRHANLWKIKLLDIYEGQNVSENGKNVTLRLYYRNADKTMTHEEVEQLHEETLAHLHENFRDFIL